MLDFIKQHPFLIGWLCFVILVYLHAYLDYVYYRFNVKEKVLKIYDALTEEE